MSNSTRSVDYEEGINQWPEYIWCCLEILRYHKDMAMSSSNYTAMSVIDDQSWGVHRARISTDRKWSSRSSRCTLEQFGLKPRMLISPEVRADPGRREGFAAKRSDTDRIWLPRRPSSRSSPTRKRRHCCSPWCTSRRDTDTAIFSAFKCPEVQSFLVILSLSLVNPTKERGCIR